VRRACLLLLFVAGPAWADPPKLVVPAEVKPDGQYAVMTPVTDAVEVTYIGLDGIEPFPKALVADKKTFALDCYGKPAYRYRFAAVASSATGEQVRKDFVLVVGGGPPPPQPPGPGPVPPGPTPPGPSPDPALVAALTAAYRAEIATDPDGRMLAFLAGAMDKTAEAVAAAETNAALIAASKKLTAEAVGPALAGTRAAIGKHLNATLPGGVVTLTADNRPQFAAAYKAVAAALRGVQR
jgi:hypothetical protein